jgi:hypothetical protein
VLQVASPESGGLFLVVPRCHYRLKEFVVNWFSHHGVSFHAGERLALEIVVLLPGIALLKLVIWLLTPRRNKDESERDYWRMHGG